MNIVRGYIKIYATSQKFTKRSIIRENLTWDKTLKQKRNQTKSFSIYTLSDVGDLSNLISSLSRTIQQYSAPCEWIMCELGFFLNF